MTRLYACAGATKLRRPTPADILAYLLANPDVQRAVVLGMHPDARRIAEIEAVLIPMMEGK